MSDFYPVSLNFDDELLTDKTVTCSNNDVIRKESSVSNSNKDVEIKIRDHEMANNTFVRYCIEVYIKSERHFWYEKTGEKSWNILRRYSDFDSLRNTLVKLYPACLVPPLPCKVNSLIPWRAVNQMNDTDFIDSRRQRLEWFLARLLAHPKLGQELIVLEFVKNVENWSDIQTTIEHRLSGVVNWRWINVQSRLIHVFDSTNSASQLNDIVKSKTLSNESLQLVERGQDLQQQITDLLQCLTGIEEQTSTMHKLYKNYGEAFYDWCGNEKEAGDSLQSFSHLCDNFSNMIESPSVSSRPIVIPESRSGGDGMCNGLSWYEISLLLNELYDYGESWIELGGRMALLHRKINRQLEHIDELNNQLNRLKRGLSPKSGAFAQLKNKFSKSPSLADISQLTEATESDLFEQNKSLISLKSNRELFHECVEEESRYFEDIRSRHLQLIMRSYACNQLAYSQACLNLWRHAKQTI